MLDLVRHCFSLYEQAVWCRSVDHRSDGPHLQIPSFLAGLSSVSCLVLAIQQDTLRCYRGLDSVNQLIRLRTSMNKVSSITYLKNGTI